jgi:hypothetical protein
VPERALDIEVIRNGRPFGTDYDALRDALRGWLRGNKWDEGLWGQFEANVRYAGEGKIRAVVRAD